jgi:hypothetical protein
MQLQKGQPRENLQLLFSCGETLYSCLRGLSTNLRRPTGFQSGITARSWWLIGFLQQEAVAPRGHPMVNIENFLSSLSPKARKYLTLSQ